MGKKIRSTIATIITVIAVLFTIMAVFTILTTEKGKAPEMFGMSAMVVVSGSMEPEIPVGSVILVKKCEPADVAEGDIISFYSRDESIRGQINTHRVIGIEELDGQYQFETKGDANVNSDAVAVLGEDLIGRVVGISPIFGKLAKIVSSRLGMLLVIVVPLAIIFALNAKDVAKIYKETLKEEAALEEQKRSGRSDEKDEEE
ncbi:MAG: signal peptidase I [Firmicutes bacterium]|nr:signal peptidase I [Bacillota bacterium]